MSTLVVVAHPDDETLGCGGTIARLGAQGGRIDFAIMCNSRVPQHHIDKALACLLPEEVEGTVIMFRRRDQQLDRGLLITLIKALERLIAEIQPTTVYTHHPDDLNLDHSITHRAVMTACRPGTSTVKTVYAMEIPSSTEWAQTHGFHPTTYVDIAATIDVKIRAMETYESEARPVPHPRSPENLRALARTRGAAAGLEYAEAFQLIREIV